MKIGIVGAGLVGRLMALALLLKGAEIDLFDQSSNSENSCAFVAAGMLSPICESILTSATLMNLGLDSLTLWMSVQKLLKEKFLELDGTIVLAHSQEQSELEQFVKSVKCIDKIERLDYKSLQNLEPALERFNDAVFVSGEGHVNSRCFLDSVLAYLLENGVRFWGDKPVGKLDSGLIEIDDGVLVYDFVIDTRGLGARLDVPKLRGVRGEIITVRTDEINLKFPLRLLHPRHPIYIVPRPNNHFLVGATTIEAEGDSFVSVQSTVELLNTLYSVHEAFAEARIVELHAQNRPAFFDNEPQIILSKKLIKINGLYRHGFMVAPKFTFEVARFLASGEFEEQFKKNYVKDANYALVN